MIARWAGTGLLFMLLAAASAPAAGGTIEVESAWARASAGAGRSGAVYVRLVNRGRTADALIGVDTARAKRAALHEHRHEGEMMKMRPVARIEIPPGAALEMKPGARHIMLFGLAEPLTEGETLALTLRLETAGALEVTARVAGVAAMGPGEQHTTHGEHD
jgi:copper(I)-binding protein